MTKETEKKEIKSAVSDELEAAMASADKAAEAAVIKMEEDEKAAAKLAKSKAKTSAVALRAVHSPIRNPVSGQLFNVVGPATPVLDIEAPSEKWTKLQIKAGILIEVEG